MSFFVRPVERHLGQDARRLPSEIPTLQILVLFPIRSISIYSSMLNTLQCEKDTRGQSGTQIAAFIDFLAG